MKRLLTILLLLSSTVFGQMPPIPFGTGKTTPVPFNTWDPSRSNSGVVLSNGNLTATWVSGSYPGAIGLLAFGKTSGDYYFEVADNTSSGNEGIGIGNASTDLTSNIGNDANSFGYFAFGLYLWNAANVSVGSPPTYTSGDTINVAINKTAGKIWVGKNGVWLNSGNPVLGTNPSFSTLTGTWFPAISLRGGGVMTANFGASPFAFSSTTIRSALSAAGWNMGWF